MNSLARRLDLVLAVSLVVFVGGVWALGHFALSNMSTNLVLTRLQHDGEAMLAAFHIGGDGLPRVGRRRLPPIYSQPYSGHYYILATEAGERIPSRSLWDKDLDTSLLQPGETRHWYDIGPDNQTLLLWSGGFEKSGNKLTLTIAEDVSSINRMLHQLEVWFGLFALGCLLLAMLIQRLVIRRGFRRLDPLYKDIERIERGESLQLTEDVPVEILPLVNKLNQSLTILGKHMERSRNAVGNLAHALKAPLGILLQDIEGPGLKGRPELQNSLIRQAGRIKQLMDRELKRARLAGVAGPGRIFQPAIDIPDLIYAVKRLHADRDLEFVTDLDQGVHHSDRDDMLELLGNLLDNAGKWATRKVQCTAHNNENGWEYTIEDDGPGCAENVLDNITKRGVKIDESIDGYGLGLAIVQDIVRLYGGRLQLDRSLHYGGLRAIVTFVESSR